MKKTSINNGKKGGRPKADSKIYIKIPGINLVNLTQEQYNNLVIKYGYDLLNKSICILEDWLENNKNKSKKYLGKTIEILCEGFDDKKQMYLGRDEFGRMAYFKSEKNIIGEFILVKIDLLFGFALELLLFF